jgi:GntR family transcriptional repressor for pyruvate dehydrogenase complex
MKNGSQSLMYQRIGSQRQPLSQQVAEQIIGLITSRELKPGDVLPSQQELSEYLGVSRTVVREGLQVLTGLGVIQVSQGIRAQVIETDPARLSTLIRISAGGGSKGMENLLAVREILEPEIAAKAALKATPQDIARLEQAIAAMDKALEAADMEAYILADNDYHLSLAAAADNDLLLYVLYPIVSLLQEMRRVAVRAHGATAQAQVCHHAMLEQLKHRDANGARETMRMHLAQIRDAISQSTQKDDGVLEFADG